MEIWLPVVEFPDHYEVSDLGRIRRVKGGDRNTVAGRILRVAQIHPRGYKKVSFCVDGKVAQRAVHRVVARAFLGPVPEGCEVDHIDADPRNNELQNLRYLQRKQNRQPGGLAKRKVFDIPKILGMRKQGLSQEKIAEELGVCQTTISRYLIQAGQRSRFST